MTQTIIARLNHPAVSEDFKDLYCFDAPEHGLIGEPFVRSATDAIHLPLRWTLGFEHFGNPADPTAYRMSQEVQLDFSAEESDLHGDTTWPVVRLDLVGPSGNGHDYEWQVVHPEDAVEQQDWAAIAGLGSSAAWLCPVLLSYFPGGAPETFYCRVQELQPPLRG